MAVCKRKPDVEARGHGLGLSIALALLVAGLVFLGACGSPETGEKTLDTVSEPGVTQPPPPDPNAVPPENQREKKRKERPINETTSEPGPSTPKPAPEDSEVSAMMNSDGSITEIRVFRSHPQIARAEARWMEPSNKDLKVFLRNGKILEAKTDKIPYLHDVSSELLLQIVGIKPTSRSTNR